MDFASAACAVRAALDASAATVLAQADGDPSAGLADLTLGDYLLQGGVVMWAILLLSLLLAFLVFHLLTVVRPEVLVPEEGRKAVDLVLQGGADERLRNVLHEHDSAYTRSLRVGLEVQEWDPDAMRASVESAGRREASWFQRRVSWLYGIAVTAPMLGLLGTVWGMIGAFGAVTEADPLQRAGILGASIARALGTTAAGLVVGVIAMALWFVFRGRATAAILTLEERLEAAAARLVHRRTRGTASAAEPADAGVEA